VNGFVYGVSMTQKTRSMLNIIATRLEFRIIGCVCKLLAASALVLILSIVSSNPFAQESQATLTAPDEGTISELITIDWVGPDEKGDVIAVAEVGAKKTINKTPAARGNPLTVQMPAEPGEYESRYILRQGRTVLSTRPIKVTSAEVSLNAPDEASISSLVSINWVGPNSQGDVIAVAEAGAKKTINKTPTARGNSLTVQMPAEPGEYELRYILRQGRTVLATRLIKVTAAEVALNAPDEATISSTVSISWVGPDAQGDTIAVAKIGEKNTINKTPTALGNPLTVQMPVEPGEYELRYILRQGRIVLATLPIKVTAAEVALNAPDEASISSMVSINWVGPNAQGDVIAVAEVGSKKTINKTPVARGNPLTVQMPVEPGEYELRYILRQGRTVLATQPIKVTAAEVSLIAPKEVSIASSVSIDWVGPDAQGDTIAIAEVGAKNTFSKTPTARGNPLTLKMPVEPGEYELRYILRQGRTVLATQPITVKKAEVELQAPDVATAGESVSIG